ncbi:hypothetical protein L6452_05372 [Arctium lappa]|uniref:Uncharacterized protein n=1 Tax=Arctium lappa TaxID=4217 RepID=A0ACB9EFY7_ARCLA|nr:hypothetical protein L6452_05372 [Arctium lappa]
MAVEKRRIIELQEEMLQGEAAKKAVEHADKKNENKSVKVNDFLPGVDAVEAIKYSILLRDVQPELMDGLIKATKNGDQQKFLELSGTDKLDLGDTGEEEGETDYDDDKEEEGFGDYHDIATRWFDGLVNKDVNITNEIYSLSIVDFDRQELRKLLRNFCSMQERNATTSEEKVGGETCCLAGFCGASFDKYDMLFLFPRAASDP